MYTSIDVCVHKYRCVYVYYLTCFYLPCVFLSDSDSDSRSVFQLQSVSAFQVCFSAGSYH